MIARCPDYWIIDEDWRRAEKAKFGAEEALRKLREHARTCHQCRLWWLRMVEILKNGGKNVNHNLVSNDGRNGTPQ